MELNIKESKISGCYKLNPKIISDNRGVFVKTFHEHIFTQAGLETCFAEEYYSVSHKGVLRGLHFQTPPKEHTKIVYCVYGEVMDVVVDLRVGSPTYGKYDVFDLNSEKANMLYIPKGLAHGFYVKSNSAVLMYKVTTIYSPENDTGIRWDSVGIPWPIDNPIISERDRMLPKFEDIHNIFAY